MKTAKKTAAVSALPYAKEGFNFVLIAESHGLLLLEQLPNEGLGNDFVVHNTHNKTWNAYASRKTAEQYLTKLEWTYDDSLSNFKIAPYPNDVESFKTYKHGDTIYKQVRESHEGLLYMLKSDDGQFIVVEPLTRIITGHWDENNATIAFDEAAAFLDSEVRFRLKY